MPKQKMGGLSKRAQWWRNRRVERNSSPVIYQGFGRRYLNRGRRYRQTGVLDYAHSGYPDKVYRADADIECIICGARIKRYEPFLIINRGPECLKHTERQQFNQKT